MPNEPILTKPRSDAGYTLVEVLIAATLSGFLFFALMSLMGQTFNFASYFHGAASSIEGSGDAISQLNAIMPQMVRIRSCGCNGTPSTSLSACVWSEPTSGDPSIGKDPVQSFSGSDADPGLEIFAGDFEWFGGNARLGGLGGLDGLKTANISASSLGGCINSSLDVFTGVVMKGCKLPVQLLYKSPTHTAGNVPSQSGALKIIIGNQDAATGGVWIGKQNARGETALGVSQLSCGFVQSGATAQSSGMLFALNMKLKSRASTETKVSSRDYESWYPGETNYTHGTLRELRLKYSFRNLSTRGVYQWRVQGKRSCLQNGVTAVDKSDCCSLAMDGGNVCRACKAAGTVSVPASECCSEQLSGASACM